MSGSTPAGLRLARRRTVGAIRSAATVVRRESREWVQSVLRAIPGEIGCAARRRLSGASVGAGSRILQHVIIHHPGGLTIGRASGVSSLTQINAAGGVTIGDHVLIGPGCTIWSQNHQFAPGMPIALQDYDLAPVAIEDDVWIGAGAIVLPGVTLRRGTVVAAGSVVTRSSTANAVLAGVPARRVSSRETREAVPCEVDRMRFRSSYVTSSTCTQ
jgi:acetyltransferase-like isoleucine patch superfamily enzyme